MRFSVVFNVLLIFAIPILTALHPVPACAVLGRHQPEPTPAEKTAAGERNHSGAKEDKKPKWKDGELIVKFKSNSDEQTREKTHARLGAIKKKQFPHLRIHYVKLKKGMTVQEAIQEYQKDPAVEYAEPNFVYTAEALPTDTRFNELWAMRNTGQTGGTAGADIKATEAWNITTGSRNVVVAVIDTGIDYTHEDLTANLWSNPGEMLGNLVDDDANGYPDDIYGIDTYNHSSWPFDDNGHGTHVAGTIGAVGNNGTGVAGVNWQVQILACKFLDAGGSGDTSGAIECLEYIRKLKSSGVDIVATNNSWGGGEYSQALYDAINAQRDILFIAAAGNNWADLDNSGGFHHYPSDYDLPNVISVTATDHKDNKALFSNYGRRRADISAPGVKILSTLPAANEWNISGGYGLLSGTSMATPHVTGLAALIKSQNAALDWIGLKNLLLAGGDNVSNMYERTVTGKRINAYGSLTCSNKPVFSALSVPSTLTVGTAETVSALSINCAVPVGPVVLRTSSGEVITLADDGVGADLAAGDGIFTGTWTPRGTKAILLFSSPAGQDAVEYPAPKISGYTENANHDTAYSDSVSATDGYPPYTWSILSGSLPPGITFDAATAQFSGSSTQSGIYPFTVQVADAYGAKALKDLSINVNPAGVSKAWDTLIDSNGWIIIYDDASTGNVVDLAVDSYGNSYVTRFGYGPREDGQPGSDQVFFLVKYDQGGNILWISKSVYGDISGLAIDRDGNAFIAGLGMTWSGTSGVGDHYVLAKYNPKGEVLWTREGQSSQVEDVATDSHGNVYINTYRTIIKYDPNGNQLWAKEVTEGYPSLLVGDDVGNLYLAGLAIGGETWDLMVTKYDANGTSVWTKTYDNGGDDYVQDLAVDKNGNAYLTGWTVATPAKPFLIKFNGNGVLQWNQKFASEFGSKGLGVAVDENNVYVTGEFQSSPYAATDFLVQKYDLSGNRIWSISLDSGETERGDRLAIDPAGNIIVAGNGANYTRALTYKITDDSIFAITTDSLPGGVSGLPYSTASFAVKGGTAPFSWSVTPGSLPSGMAIDPATGAISGIPDGRWGGVIEVKVADGSGKRATRRFMLQIMGIDNTALNQVTTGVPYDQVITGGGGMAPYVWSVTSGSLPGGLYLENTEEGAVHIKGTATVAGTYPVTLTMEDATGKKAAKPLTLTVAAPACVASPVRISRTPVVLFDSVQQAMDAAIPGEVLQLQATSTSGNIATNRDISLRLQGGYDCYFASNSGYATIHGSLIVASGLIELENIILAP